MFRQFGRHPNGTTHSLLIEITAFFYYILLNIHIATRPYFVVCPFRVCDFNTHTQQKLKQVHWPNVRELLPIRATNAHDINWFNNFRFVYQSAPELLSRASSTIELCCSWMKFLLSVNFRLVVQSSYTYIVWGHVIQFHVWDLVNKFPFIPRHFAMNNKYFFFTEIQRPERRAKYLFIRVFVGV